MVVTEGASAAQTDPLDVKIDRPFLFAIRDTETGTLLFLGRSVLSGLDFLRPAGGIVVRGLLALIAFVASVFRLAGRGVGIAVHAVGQACLSLDRLITPRRAIAVVAMAAAGLLVASQFIDYRATEIGQPGYIAVETITNAPRVEQMTPIDSHSFLLVIAGLVGGDQMAGQDHRVDDAESRPRMSGLRGGSLEKADVEAGVVRHQYGIAAKAQEILERLFLFRGVFEHAGVDAEVRDGLLHQGGSVPCDGIGAPVASRQCGRCTNAGERDPDGCPRGSAGRDV